LLVLRALSWCAEDTAARTLSFQAFCPSFFHDRGHEGHKLKRYWVFAD